MTSWIQKYKNNFNNIYSQKIHSPSYLISANTQYILFLFKWQCLKPPFSHSFAKHLTHPPIQPPTPTHAHIHRVLWYLLLYIYICILHIHVIYMYIHRVWFYGSRSAAHTREALWWKKNRLWSRGRRRPSCRLSSLGWKKCSRCIYYKYTVHAHDNDIR